MLTTIILALQLAQGNQISIKQIRAPQSITAMASIGGQWYAVGIGTGLVLDTTTSPMTLRVATSIPNLAVALEEVSETPLAVATQQAYVTGRRPADGFSVKVHISGVKQTLGKHYTVTIGPASATVTFSFPMTAALATESELNFEYVAAVAR